MKIKKFNESEVNGITLRDLIGDIKNFDKIGYQSIYETSKGCFTNIDLGSSLSGEKDKFGKYQTYLDGIVTTNIYGDYTGDISIKVPGQRYGSTYYCYFENDIPKIISNYPGDERGCFLFDDVFIVSGHDGNYLWNIKTGRFAPNTW